MATIRPNDGKTFAVKLASGDWVDAVSIINDSGNIVDPSSANRTTVIGTVNGVALLTRPADVTAYAAGDEISNSTTAGSAYPFLFEDVALVAGGNFTITAVSVSTSGVAAVITRLLIYNASPTMVGDNTVMGKAADRGKLIASLALAQVVAGSGAEEGYLVSSAALPTSRLKCATGSTDVYGVLYAAAATPTSAMTFHVSITVDRD